MVGVSGIFKELPQNLLDPERFFGFRRIFTVEVNGDGLCQVVNEQYHISNALSTQIIHAFKIPKPVISHDTMLPQTEKQHNQLIHTLKIITNLNTAWAKKLV